MARKSLGVASSATADVPTRGEVQSLISAAGGGGAAVLPFTSPPVGQWLASAASGVGTFNPANGSMTLGGLFLPAGTYDAAGFNVNTAGSAGAVVKVAIYADNGGVPGTLLIDTAAVDVTTTGFKSITGLSLVAPAGGRLVWAGTVTQGTPTTVPVIHRHTVSAYPIVWNSNSPNLTYSPPLGVQTTGVTGAAPASAGLSLAEGYARLAFRRSA